MKQQVTDAAERTFFTVGLLAAAAAGLAEPRDRGGSAGRGRRGRVTRRRPAALGGPGSAAGRSACGEPSLPSEGM